LLGGLLIFSIAAARGLVHSLEMKSLVLCCFAALLAACGPTYVDVDPQPAGWRAPGLSAPDQWERTVNLKSTTSGP
jgi:hypothetical protein